MTKLKRSAQNVESKAQEKKFLVISLIVTALLLTMLYFVFRNAF